MSSTLATVGVGSKLEKEEEFLPSKNPVAELNLHWPAVEPLSPVVPLATLVPSVPVSFMFSKTSLDLFLVLIPIFSYPKYLITISAPFAGAVTKVSVVVEIV